MYVNFVGGPLNPPADYVLTSEYFDKGDWEICLQRDSAHDVTQNREYFTAEPVKFTDTGTWKEASVTLTNCLFSDRQNTQTDMRLLCSKSAHIRNLRIAPKKQALGS